MSVVKTKGGLPGNVLFVGYNHTLPEKDISRHSIKEIAFLTGSRIPIHHFLHR
jgi:hypothetical protein